MADVQEGRRRDRLYLAGALLILGWGLLVLFSEDLRSLVFPARQEGFGVANFNFSADPQLGFRLRKEDNDPHGPFWLIVAGNCDECSSKTLKNLVDSLSQHGLPCLILHSAADEHHLREALQHLTGVTIRKDTSLRGKTLNAVFVPRIYLFDGNGSLAWLQHKQNELPPRDLVEELRK